MALERIIELCERRGRLPKGEERKERRKGKDDGRKRGVGRVRRGRLKVEISRAIVRFRPRNRS